MVPMYISALFKIKLFHVKIQCRSGKTACGRGMSALFKIKLFHVKIQCRSGKIACGRGMSIAHAHFVDVYHMDKQLWFL